MSTYQGWTNYETWAVKLWLDNEQSTYSEVTEQARQQGINGVYDLAQWLESFTEEVYVTDQAPTSGLAADLFMSAWQNVNWREIAEAYLADAEEERDDEDEEDDE